MKTTHAPRKTGARPVSGFMNWLSGLNPFRKNSGLAEHLEKSKRAREISRRISAMESDLREAENMANNPDIVSAFSAVIEADQARSADRIAREPRFPKFS